MNHKANTSKKPVYVGVDDGHYAIKVVTEDGQYFSMPSRAKAGKHVIQMQGDSASVDGGIYHVDGQPYTVNQHLSDSDDTRFQGYPLSALNRVLVHAGLRRAGFSGKVVHIATGLPVSHYYSGPEVNTTLIDGKVKNLKQLVTCDYGDCAIIEGNIVTTEAIAAFYDQLMDMDGQPTPVFEEVKDVSVGVIDIGGKTTDCAVILPGGQNIDTKRSGSSDVGILMLNEQVERKIRSKFDLDTVPTKMVEMAIATGQINVYGKAVDVSDIVQHEKEQLAMHIMSTVNTKIGSGKDLGWVLFVGGGSIVMREQLEKYFPHARFPDKPEFANARGMLKIAKYIFGDQG